MGAAAAQCETVEGGGDGSAEGVRMRKVQWCGGG
jgi:hypothetical protein